MASLITDSIVVGLVIALVVAGILSVLVVYKLYKKTLVTQAALLKVVNDLNKVKISVEQELRLSEDILGSVSKARKSMLDLVRNDLKTQNINLYRQVVASRDLENLLGMGIGRNLRGWALSPDALIVILNYIKLYKPALILELGGGYSTVAVEHFVRANGLSTKIISVDHDKEFLRQTSQQIASSKVAQLIEAPLKDYDGYRWYDMQPIDSAIEKIGKKIDLVIVDGPPMSTNPFARRPVMERLGGYLNKKYGIFLDDAARIDERNAVDDWLSKDKSLKHHYIYTEKGLSLLYNLKDVEIGKIL